MLPLKSLMGSLSRLYLTLLTRIYLGSEFVFQQA